MPRSPNSDAPLVVVGVPGSKRAAALGRALTRAGRTLPRWVSWLEAIQDPSLLARVGSPGDLLRIESPGDDSEVWHALARAGGLEHTYQRGEWRPGEAWFRGMRFALEAIAAHGAHLVATHPVEHVLAMTDKRSTSERLRAAGVPTPALAIAPTSADDLRERLAAGGHHAVFVKPRWGSSGAGVLAYRWQNDRETLVTTAKISGERVWNDKRLTTHTDRQSIDRLLSMVIAGGAVVERWIPKACSHGGPFDLRVLVVAGRAQQRIARVGRGTITNLHLDSARLPADVALGRFGANALRDVLSVCERAAACFPGHVAVGVDVMVDPRGRPFVLECNAWGDYLPNLMVDGMDSYDIQVEALWQTAA